MQVIAEATGDILYTVRVSGNRFQPRVYSPGSFTVKVGRDRPDGISLTGLRAIRHCELPRVDSSTVNRIPNPGR